jgi:predicted  nucleic acid-binding Zn-ribbon protein
MEMYAREKEDDLKRALANLESANAKHERIGN